MKSARSLIRVQDRAAGGGPMLARDRKAVGKPLAASVRYAMEPRFGHDFGSVRIHTDAAASSSPRALGARAYTLGTDIAFAAGEYAPDKAAGRELLAHELAHVAQQARGGKSSDAEARADAAARRVMRGLSVGAVELGAAARGVQTKPDEPAVAGPEDKPDVITGADAGASANEPAAAATSATVLDGFARDKSALNKKQLGAIDQIAFSIWLHLSLYADAKAAIAVTGHTDTTGSEKHNTGLGAARGDSAKAALEAALAKLQIEAGRFDSFTATSLGETRLRVPTADEVDEPANRRVEIEVTIKVQAPPPRTTPPEKPLPGLPGGPKIYEVPGLMEEPDPIVSPPAPRVPKSKGEWLEEALKRDPVLKKLPKGMRDKAIGALKDADEKAVDAIIDALPLDGDYKKAAKAAAKALLQTLKGRKFKPPPEPPRGIPEDMLKTPSFPKAPGEMIFKLPPIRF